MHVQEHSRMHVRLAYGEHPRKPVNVRGHPFLFVLV